MKTITNKEYEEWQRYKDARDHGRILTPEFVRFICESVDYDPQKIGEYFLEVLPKVCPLPDCFYEEYKAEMKKAGCTPTVSNAPADA